LIRAGAALPAEWRDPNTINSPRAALDPVLRPLYTIVVWLRQESAVVPGDGRTNEWVVGSPHAAEARGGGLMSRFRSLVFTFLALSISAIVPGVARAQAPAYLLQWGSSGTGDGQFNGPAGMAVDAGGNVYVADYGNHRVQKFSPTGTYLAQWGTHGSGDGQFNGPEGLAVDAAGNVYVADFGNNRVEKFTSAGAYLAQWGTFGAGAGQFQSPLGVAVDAGGNVYVADNMNFRIQKFTDSGAFVAQWGTPGSGDGQFYNPTGVAVDAAGNVYVCDSGNSGLHNDRVQKFSPTGAYLTQWGTHGSGDGQFDTTWGLAVDAAGNVDVADFRNHRVQSFTDTGTYLTQWGTQGSGNGQFYFPYSVAADAAGNVYVAEVGNNRVQKFGPLPTPTKATTWGRLKTLYR
jgi:DNA-binding beta-propeller fold protein YncE